MRSVCLILLCAAGFACNRSTSQQNTKRQFDSLYARRIIETEQPKVRIKSDSRVFTSLPSYRRIVGMGRPALPYIREKMVEEHGFGYMLVFAAIEIEGWKDSDFPQTAVQEVRDEVLKRMDAQH